MSKYASINTLDHRLAMMGFHHPDSTKRKEYVHANGDRLSLEMSFGTPRWYLYAAVDIRFDSFGKRSVVFQMEDSGLYGGAL